MVSGDASTSGDISGREIHVRYEFPENLRVLFADTALIQNSEDAFYLSFFQVEHATALAPADTSEPVQVPAVCVARVAITPQHAVRFLQSLELNIRRFRSRLERAAQVAAQTEMGDEPPRMSRHD